MCSPYSCLSFNPPWESLCSNPRWNWYKSAHRAEQSEWRQNGDLCRKHLVAIHTLVITITTLTPTHAQGMGWLPPKIEESSPNKKKRVSEELFCLDSRFRQYLIQHNKIQSNSKPTRLSKKDLKSNWLNFRMFNTWSESIRWAYKTVPSFCFRSVLTAMCTRALSWVMEYSALWMGCCQPLYRYSLTDGLCGRMFTSQRTAELKSHSSFHMLSFST